MEYIGYIFGLVSFVMCCTLSSKVSKLDRMMKQAGIGKEKSDSLKEVFEKNVGQVGIMEFESDEENTDLNQKECHILDVDEDWVLLKTLKKDVVKLIRIDSIKNIRFTNRNSN